MKRFLVFILILLFGFRQDKVMICKSATAYAYHSHRCQGLKECTHAIEYLTLEEAVSLKRTPCGYCYKNARPTTEPSSGKIQCSARTKKGTQCSRTASANGYCWQHNK